MVILFLSIILQNIFKCLHQRWSPRGHPWPQGHILKFLAMGWKPQVLKNCPGLGSRTALFFAFLKFCRSPEKKFDDLFIMEIA